MSSLTKAPMSAIRLFLDEDVWPGLAVVLREQGFDVVHAYEAGRGGRPDAEQLAFAAQSGRAILTHNTQDYVPLAVDYFYGYRPHSGVIVSPQLEKGELIRRTLNLLRARSAQDLANTVQLLADYR